MCCTVCRVKVSQWNRFRAGNSFYHCRGKQWSNIRYNVETNNDQMCRRTMINVQANKDLSAYFRPLPPSLALKQDGQAAWALVSSHHRSNPLCQTPCWHSVFSSRLQQNSFCDASFYITICDLWFTKDWALKYIYGAWYFDDIGVLIYLS